MAGEFDCDVIVIGAGPVGLTLSLDLARRGISVMLVERNAVPLRLPKMERSNPRTMEIYRRLGLVDRIRAAAFPADAPMDVVIATSLTEEPLVRQVYPSVDETRARIAACTDGSLPREPYQLVSQYTLEPILLAEARATPGLTVLSSTEFLSLEQDEDGVTATVRPADGGDARTLHARYLVGSDGGGGIVRKQIDVRMEGRAGLGTITNIFFRCDDFLDKSRIGLARHYCFASVAASGGAAGVIVIQDDCKHLAYHTQMPEGFDPAQALRDVTGLDIQPEILHASPWTQHLLVAERHKVGRVFLAGDANHLYIPAGGLGMNTGIVDAINLGWKLAATVQGWGGPALLESYDSERRYGAQRNLRAVTGAIEGVMAWRGSFTEAVLHDPAARAAFAELAEPQNRKVYEMHGADLGYRYTSAVIDDGEGPAPECPIMTFEPSTHPGSHLPHAWIAPRVAVYDRIATDGFTLLGLGDGEDPAELAEAFAAIGAPFQTLTLPADLRAVYARRYLLIRPDLHVVWRGDTLPDDPARLARIATGNA